MKRLMIYSKRKLPDLSGGKDMIKKNGILIFLIVVFMCGLITGISVFFGAEHERELISMFSERFSNRSPLQFFLYGLVMNGVPMIIALLGGVSAAGIPFVVAVPFVKGVFDGILSAYLIGTYMTSGYGYYALITVPGGCIGVFSLLYLCDMCFSVSQKVFRTSFTEMRENINTPKMLTVFGICLLGGVASSLLQLLTKLIFGGIFRL